MDGLIQNTKMIIGIFMERKEVKSTLEHALEIHYEEITRLISIESQPKKIVVVVVVYIGVIIVVHIVVVVLPVVDPRNLLLKLG